MRGWDSICAMFGSLRPQGQLRLACIGCRMSRCRRLNVPCSRWIDFGSVLPFVQIISVLTLLGCHGWALVFRRRVFPDT